MIFKIILTVLIAFSSGAAVESIGKPREPISAFIGWGNFIGNLIIIYGLWNWL